MPESAFRTPVDILLVEDNEGHALLLRQVLEESRMRTMIHVVERGEDALRFLRKEPPYTQARRPQLIILDLYLPGLEGMDVLKELKQDPSLRAIPVIILTASAIPEDVVKAYDQGARAFIVKPHDLDAFESAVQSIEAFWIQTAKLPID